MFEKDADFGEIIFKGNVGFSGATFRTTISFEGSQAATVELGVHRPTILWWEKDREGVTLKDWSSGRSFWGFARRSFQKMDERERADAAYYFEKLWQWRSRLSHTARISTRIPATVGYPFDLILFRIPTAYGTSLIRPLMSWFVVITLFGGLYAGFPSLLGRTVKSIWTLSNWVISMHFSVTTFTTLGLGDIYPGRLLGRALTSIEAMVGAVLMALTVVVISRKLMR
ncbi:two pore domain potassium channel family protein [Candidatus Bipolaricaulota bacterium]|nr:two pore domain potassium channel family protein [Candidatus Bipolaricaulota bacterium]